MKNYLDHLEYNNNGSLKKYNLIFNVIIILSKDNSNNKFKILNKENGNSKYIHNDFGERKCHCKCVALRGDSQNQSES